MDRLFIIKIINDYLISDNNDLVKIIDNAVANYNLFSQEESSKKEIDLLYNLFNKYPYYLVPYAINEIKKDFRKISASQPIYQKYTILVEGYFLELMPTIERRIETEINGHLIYLLRKYYEKNNNLPSETKKVLKTNIYSTELLVGYNLLKDEQYHQEELIPFASQNFREKVSINNYKLYYRSQKNLIELIMKYFSSDDFDKFIANLEIILIELNKEDNQTKIISELIFNTIIKINQSLLESPNTEELELLKYL